MSLLSDFHCRHVKKRMCCKNTLVDPSILIHFHLKWKRIDLKMHPYGHGDEIHFVTSHWQHGAQAMWKLNDWFTPRRGSEFSETLATHAVTDFYRNGRHWPLKVDQLPGYSLGYSSEYISQNSLPPSRMRNYVWEMLSRKPTRSAMLISKRQATPKNKLKLHWEAT